ncbi:alpha/beta fold hydrolase [Marinomonas epiphytica]
MRKRIETEQFGNIDQPAIFMLSGWGMPKEVMRPFAKRLSEKFYVVLASLPGISQTEAWIDRSRTGMNYDIDALSEQFIEAAPKNAWWFGWSLGGMIATYIAARRSSCVKGLVTFASSPSFVQRDSWPYGMLEAEFDQFASLIESSPIMGLKRFWGLQAKGAQNTRELIKLLAAQCPPERLNSSALNGGLRLLKSLDVRREMRVLNVPNLHIIGEDDALVNPQGLMDLSCQNEQMTLRVVEACAHQAFIEHETLCYQEVEKFVNAHPG